MTTRNPNWRALSPRGRAILKWIAVPISTSLSHREVAYWLELNRTRIRIVDDSGTELALPSPVTEGWVSARMRELRRELESGEDREMVERDPPEEVVYEAGDDPDDED